MNPADQISLHRFGGSPPLDSCSHSQIKWPSFTDTFNWGTSVGTRPQAALQQTHHYKNQNWRSDQGTQLSLVTDS